MLDFKRLLGSVAIAGMFASSATLAAGDHFRKADDSTAKSYNGQTVNEIEDMRLVNRNGEKIGEVEQVLVDRNDRVAAVVVGVDNYGAIDQRDIVVKLDQVSFDRNNRDQIVASYDEAQLRNLPEWNE